MPSGQDMQQHTAYANAALWKKLNTVTADMSKAVTGVAADKQLTGGESLPRLDNVLTAAVGLIHRDCSCKDLWDCCCPRALRVPARSANRMRSERLSRRDPFEPGRAGGEEKEGA